MYCLSYRSLVVCAILPATGFATQGAVPLPFIYNQSSNFQNGWFQLDRTLANSGWVGEIQFSEDADSIGVGGLWAHADPLNRKGAMTAIQGEASITSSTNHAQAGTALGRLGSVSAFVAQGDFTGSTGIGTASSLVNFANDKTSFCVGTRSAGGATAGSSLFLDGVGRYWIGGSLSELNGDIDGNPGLGAAAAVIGVDAADPSSSAPHYAGYFAGDVCITKNLAVQGGSILLDSATNPGRTFEIISGGRQEVYNTNDLVFFSGGNINMRPGVSTGNQTFMITDAAGTNTLFAATPQTNRVVIGNGSPQSSHILTVYGSACATGGFITCSAERFKESIDTIEQAREVVQGLRGVRYTTKATGKREIGLIAEEVAQVLPELVAFEEDGQALGIDYSRLSAVLVEALKSQQQELDGLRGELGALRILLEERGR